MTFLAGHRLVVEAGHRDRDVLLCQAVQRIKELHVLELIGGQEQDPSPGIRHAPEVTHNRAGNGRRLTSPKLRLAGGADNALVWDSAIGKVRRSGYLRATGVGAA